MDTLLWRLLRQHLSIGQLTGFFLANLFGMVIVLLGIQFYRDVAPVFDERGNSFLKGDYLTVTKKVGTLGSLAGKSTVFTHAEIEELSKQSFARSVGGFMPAQFKVSAGMRQAGFEISTEMFFESVPDSFVDIDLNRWKYEAGSQTIPIIIPKDYLNLYNFGFAQSRNLPRLSEGLMGLIRMNIVLRGNGQTETYTGNIVGFSNRLNTLLVPQSFMIAANRRLAPQAEVLPSRLIVEVKNPTDASIARFFREKGYETEDGKLDAGKATSFLRLITGIVLAVGLLISLLSFYILMLSIFLLLQKNTVKLESLLLIGYSPARVAFPYQMLTLVLNALVFVVSIIIVNAARGYYVDGIRQLFPQLEGSSIWATAVVGAVLCIVVSAINMVVVKRKVLSVRLRRADH